MLNREQSKSYSDFNTLQISGLTLLLHCAMFLNKTKQHPIPLLLRKRKESLHCCLFLPINLDHVHYWRRPKP